MNFVDFIREMTSSSLRQCSVTPRKSDETIKLRQNTPDFIAADEWHHILQILILYILV